MKHYFRLFILPVSILSVAFASIVIAAKDNDNNSEVAERREMSEEQFSRILMDFIEDDQRSYSSQLFVESKLLMKLDEKSTVNDLIDTVLVIGDMKASMVRTNLDFCSETKTSEKLRREMKESLLQWEQAVKTLRKWKTYTKYDERQDPNTRSLSLGPKLDNYVFIGPDLPIQMPSEFIWAVSKDNVDGKRTVMFHELTLGGHIRALSNEEMKAAILRDRELRGHLAIKGTTGREEILEFK
jgi:hypothetical protein